MSEIGVVLKLDTAITKLIELEFKIAYFFRTLTQQEVYEDLLEIENEIREAKERLRRIEQEDVVQ